MEIKLSNYFTKRVIHQNIYPFNFNGKEDVNEAECQLSCESYSIKIKDKWFEGIHISIAEFNCEDSEHFFYQSTHCHIGFMFCLEGTLDFIQNPDIRLTVIQNQQHLNLGKQKDFAFNIMGKTKYIFIQLTESYYYKITNTEFVNDLLIFNQETISPEISLVLNNLINPKYSGRVKRLFLESKIFELLIFYMNDFEKETSVSIKEEDINKILYAKQLVESNLQTPVSLIELSRKVGINDYKLKKGFKELIGLTVFGYLYKIRMEKAHYFLSQEKKNVNEVAFLVGYKNAQHFITAFKKHYNILPGSLNKKIKVNTNV